MTAERITIAAHEVRKYWRDWPQERRDAVRSLSQFLADAIEELSDAVAELPSGKCPVCERFITLTKTRVLRKHNGDFEAGGWRLMCEGSGKSPSL